MGPNLLITDDPELLKHMSAARSPWRRSPWYAGMKLDPKCDTVFSTRDEKLHSEMRTMEIGAVSFPGNVCRCFATDYALVFGQRSPHVGS